MIELYHGNDNCTGSKLEMDVVKRRGTGNLLRICLKRQDSKQGEDGRRRFEDVGVEIKIGAVKAAAVVYTLEGGNKSLRDGRGIVGETSNSPILHIDRLVTPFKGYVFHIHEIGRENARNARISINETEALALRLAITSTFGDMAFI